MLPCLPCLPWQQSQDYSRKNQSTQPINLPKKNNPQAESYSQELRRHSSNGLNNKLVLLLRTIGRIADWSRQTRDRNRGRSPKTLSEKRTQLLQLLSDVIRHLTQHQSDSPCKAIGQTYISIATSLTASHRTQRDIHRIVGSTIPVLLQRRVQRESRATLVKLTTSG